MKNNCYINVKVLFENVCVRVRPYPTFPTPRLHGFPWFCLASFPQLLVLFGFHNSLNINPKQSGPSDFAWILSWFVGFFPTTPGFVRFPQLDYTNPKRSGTSDFILTFVQEQLSVSYGTRTSIESESR